MDGQLVAVGVLVTLAALYVLRATWKTWAGDGSGCGGRCSCSGQQSQGQPALIPPEELTLRKR
jgi:hypothetical protein